jgi:hypothetical protein
MENDPRLERTQFASRAATLAEQFRNAVADCPVGSHLGEMTAPEASTGGGVQALQHIRLVPSRGQGRAYVVGKANRGERMAELRSLAYVDRVSMERFGRPTGFDPGEYEQFLAAAGQFLEMFGLTVTLVNVPADDPSSRGGVTLTVGGFMAWSVFVLVIGGVVGVLATRLGWVR